MKELYDIKDSSYTDQKFDFNSYLFHRRVCFRYINIFHYSASNKFNACLFI